VQRAWDDFAVVVN